MVPFLKPHPHSSWPLTWKLFYLQWREAAIATFLLSSKLASFWSLLYGDTMPLELLGEGAVTKSSMLGST